MTELCSNHHYVTPVTGSAIIILFLSLTRLFFLFLSHPLSLAQSFFLPFCLSHSFIFLSLILSLSPSLPVGFFFLSFSLTLFFPLSSQVILSLSLAPRAASVLRRSEAAAADSCRCCFCTCCAPFGLGTLSVVGRHRPINGRNIVEAHFGPLACGGYWLLRLHVYTALFIRVCCTP